MIVDVGTLLQYGEQVVDTPPAGTSHIITEARSLITTETGSHLVTEG